jgi:hypothetical protein
MNQVEKYFNAEKYESVLFVMVGLLAISIACYFLFGIKKPFYIGVAWRLITIAIIQIVVGSSVYFRSPKDIKRVNNIVQNEKSKVTTEELPRMEVVMKNFVFYRWIEIALIVIGIVLFLLFQQNEILKGIGIGLSTQSFFMLFLDFFAERRGHDYILFLKNLF